LTSVPPIELFWLPVPVVVAAVDVLVMTVVEDPLLSGDVDGEAPVDP
jgi:hypothetical protein